MPCAAHGMCLFYLKQTNKQTQSFTLLWEVFSILQMRKLRIKKVILLAYVFTDSKWHNQNLNPSQTLELQRVLQS